MSTLGHRQLATSSNSWAQQSVGVPRSRRASLYQLRRTPLLPSYRALLVAGCTVYNDIDDPADRTDRMFAAIESRLKVLDDLGARMDSLDKRVDATNFTGHGPGDLPNFGEHEYDYPIPDPTCSRSSATARRIARHLHPAQQKRHPAVHPSPRRRHQGLSSTEDTYSGLTNDALADIVRLLDSQSWTTSQQLNSLLQVLEARHPATAAGVMLVDSYRSCTISHLSKVEEAKPLRCLAETARDDGLVHDPLRPRCFLPISSDQRDMCGGRRSGFLHYARQHGRGGRS